uniref:Uncharacterized protein n=1 Tax=Ditylenchus dipsaci TaxID=166011 RepID=A0A915E7G3_9BILA
MSTLPGSLVANYRYDDADNGADGIYTPSVDDKLFTQMAFQYARAHSNMWRTGRRSGLSDDGDSFVHGITNGLGGTTWLAACRWQMQDCQLRVKERQEYDDHSFGRILASSFTKQLHGSFPKKALLVQPKMLISTFVQQWTTSHTCQFIPPSTNMLASMCSRTGRNCIQREGHPMDGTPHKGAEKCLSQAFLQHTDCLVCLSLSLCYYSFMRC